MHVVDDVLSLKQDDEVLGGKAYSLLLHGLRHPDTRILSYSDAPLHDAHIYGSKLASLCYRVGIELHVYARQIAGKDLCLGIGFVNSLVQVGSCGQFYEPCSGRRSGFLYELCHWVGEGDGVQGAQVGHVELLSYPLAKAP